MHPKPLGPDRIPAIVLKMASPELSPVLFFSLNNKRLHRLQGRYSQPTKIPLWDASCGDCEYLSQKYNTIDTIRAEKMRKRKFYNNIITRIDKKNNIQRKVSGMHYMRGINLIIQMLPN